MPVQLIKKVRDRQPLSLVKVNWENPLIDWVDDVFLAVDGKLVKQSRPNSVLVQKTGNEVGVLASNYGIGVLNKNDSYGTYWSRSGTYATTSVSLLAVITNTTVVTDNPNIIAGVWGYYDDGFCLSCADGRKWSARVNASTNLEILGSAPITGKAGVISMAWDGATLSLKDVNGGNYSDSVSGTVAATSAGFHISGQNNAVSRGFPGGTHLVLAGRRFASLLKREYLHKNPWQIFEPETIPLFYSTGGGAATDLSIFDALHSHACENLSFSLDTYLAAQDSTHAHSADNLTLDATTSISLVLSESLHGLSSDVIALITGSYLQVADAIHGHSADALTLATASFLAVADALHAHAADNLTLDTSNATPLTAQDSAHAHSVDNTALTLDTWLAIVEAIHAQSADNVSISSEELLSVADALHSLASDALVLSLPSAPGTCPTAAEIAAAVLAAAQITPIYSDIRKVNNLSVNGSGTDGDPWGPV